jgi:hypothetical protein
MSISLVTQVAYNMGTEAVPSHPRYIEVPLYFLGHNWLVSTAISVKPVTLTLVPISSLSDDNKYILKSEVFMDTSLFWLCVSGTVLARCSLI